MRPRVVPADSQALVVEAFERLLGPELEVVGPWAYVLRSARPRDLTRALQTVLRSERRLSPALAGGSPAARPDATRVPVAAGGN